MVQEPGGVFFSNIGRTGKPGAKGYAVFAFDPDAFISGAGSGISAGSPFPCDRRTIHLDYLDRIDPFPGIPEASGFSPSTRNVDSLYGYLVAFKGFQGL